MTETQMPSAEEFLSTPEPDDDEDFEDFNQGRPFEQSDLTPYIKVISEYTERIADSLEKGIGGGVDPTVHEDLRQAFSNVNQEYADLEQKYLTIGQLVESIEAIVKPSTSKLANSVREAIVNWKTGQQQGEEVPLDPRLVEAMALDVSTEHNHAWEQTDLREELTCACGAYIDKSDPEYPQGVVREPGYEARDE